MSLREEIGLRIKERRESLGISQKELAEELGYKNRSMISLIESGRRALDVDQMKPLAKALKCSVDDLLDGDESIDNQLNATLRRLTPEQKEKALIFLSSIVSGK